MITGENFKESYNIETVKDGVVNWTVSSLSDYMYCPFLFKLKRVNEDGTFKTYDEKTLPNNNGSIATGILFHKLVQTLLQYRDSDISTVVKLILETEDTKFMSSTVEIEKLASYATELLLYIEENYRIRKIEPVIIYADILKNYTIKLSPDVITDSKVIEIKTTCKPDYYKSYLPFKYKVQYSLYKEYLNLDVDMLLVDLNTGSITKLDVGFIEKIRQKVEYSTRDLLKEIYDPISSIFPDRCSRCYFINKCMKKRR